MTVKLLTEHLLEFLMPRSHIHGSPRQFYYGLNLTDDPGNANFRSPIRMHYIHVRMIKYYYVWLRMQYRKLRTNTECHEWCRIVSMANSASSPWLCDLGISLKGGCKGSSESSPVKMPHCWKSNVTAHILDPLKFGLQSTSHIYYTVAG